MNTRKKNLTTMPINAIRTTKSTGIVEARIIRIPTMTIKHLRVNGQLEKQNVELPVILN